MRNGYIYFIQAESGPIKIGYTENPDIRFRTLKIGTHENLKFLGSITGPPEQEKEIHKILASSNIRGEWFHPTAEVLAFVDKSDPIFPDVQRNQRHAICALERASIENAIKNANGNIGHAAIALRISRRTLQNRMRDLTMPRGKSGRPISPDVPLDTHRHIEQRADERARKRQV